MTRRAERQEKGQTQGAAARAAFDFEIGLDELEASLLAMVDLVDNLLDLQATFSGQLTAEETRALRECGCRALTHPLKHRPGSDVFATVAQHYKRMRKEGRTPGGP